MSLPLSIPIPIPIPVPFPSTELDELSHTKRPRGEDDDGDRDRVRSRRRLSLPNIYTPFGSPPPAFEPASLPRVSPLAQHLRSRSHLRAHSHTPPRPRRADGMDVDDKGQLYPSVSLDARTEQPYAYPYTYSDSNGQAAVLTSPTLPASVSAQQEPPSADTALATIRWIASLPPAAAAQIPRDELALALTAVAEQLPPVDQQLLAGYVLQGHAIASLSGEDMFLLAREIAEVWAAPPNELSF